MLSSSDILLVRSPLHAILSTYGCGSLNQEELRSVKVNRQGNRTVKETEPSRAIGTACCLVDICVKKRVTHLLTNRNDHFQLP